MMIFSWQQSDWHRLARYRNKPHHGLLINGQSGIGKREFSFELCQYLLCNAVSGEDVSEEDNGPCGQCQNCRLFNAGTHPDFHVLTNELESAEGRLSLLTDYSNRYLDSAAREKKTKHSRVISVDQVRGLIERFSTHAHISTTKVALIFPADCMNINAANALLKLLEEPPPDSILVLVTANPSHLPATIRSRCMTQTLATPDKESALAWLAQHLPEQQIDIALTLANGGPLEARRLSDTGFLQHHQACLIGFAGVVAKQVNPVDFAGQLNKLEFEQLLAWFHRFVTELAKFCVTGIKPYWMESIRIDTQNVSVERLYGLYDRISYYRRIARGTVNEQLALEDLVLAFQRVVV
ncbi:hypothetical protein [Candidatus Spongiihabitans sp.]|uniref:hypothetical protein n=1 Tax=Candidatus Spongiihabitans sp. TaxID=3101308 RepID=UPI003C6FEC09